MSTVGDQARAELSGQIVNLSFEDGVDDGYWCGLEDCECPDHDAPPRQPGTYITIRLDENPRIGFSRVRVQIEKEESE